LCLVASNKKFLEPATTTIVMKDEGHAADSSVLLTEC
jgi:hypothetical protein